MSLRASERSFCKLRRLCEIAKRNLTWNRLLDIDIPNLFEGVDFHSTITRQQFEDLNDDLFRNTLELVEQALGDAEVERAMVNDVILVGGSTHIPKIQQLLCDFFDRPDLFKDINPEEVVAHGAAMQAAILNGDQFDLVRDFQLQDMTPLLLAVENNGDYRFD